MGKKLVVPPNQVDIRGFHNSPYQLKLLGTPPPPPPPPTLEWGGRGRGEREQDRAGEIGTHNREREREGDQLLRIKERRRSLAVSPSL